MLAPRRAEVIALGDVDVISDRSARRRWRDVLADLNPAPSESVPVDRSEPDGDVVEADVAGAAFVALDRERDGAAVLPPANTASYGTLIVSAGAKGRALGTVFYQAKLAWFARLHRWLAETRTPSDALVLGGDFNVAPGPGDVWDEAAAHGGTHVSPEERDAFASLLRWGLVDAYRATCDAPARYTWWDYRAGCFYKNIGMRIDHILVTEPLRSRLVWAEIDREARKGKPTPSVVAPLLVDLDEAGAPIDAGWKGAEERIAARRRPPLAKSSP